MRRVAENFAGRVAVVTGGGSGIGRGIARALASAGARVVIADRDTAGAERVQEEIRADGGGAFARTVDVTDEGQAGELSAWVNDELGSADIVVNNAGVCQMKPFLELVPDDFRRMWEVHFMGTFLISRAFLPAMLERSYGRIVNVTSGVGGFAGSPVTTHYQAAKSAQTSLTLGMAAALARRGVTVNCISPGLVVTPLWQGLAADVEQATGHTVDEEIAARLSDPYTLGRAVETEEIARVVLFLAHHESGALTGRIVDV
jgi:NAD(P)-dependent dehydrogenase (short-subunit alcohol dehydrogenase family)